VRIWVAALISTGAVAAGGTHEFLNVPTYLVFEPMADGQGGDHDAQVGLDRLADVLADAPELVGGIDDEL